MESKENKKNNLSGAFVVLMIVLLAVVGFCSYKLGEAGRKTIDDSNAQKGGNTSVIARKEEDNNEYKFTKSIIPSRTSKIIISNNQIISVTEKLVPSDPYMETGMAVYEYTVKGLKLGKANLKIDIIDTDGTKYSSTTYYFDVDSNLNVKFEKEIED